MSDHTFCFGHYLWTLLEFVALTYLVSALLHHAKNFLSWNFQITTYDSLCQLYIRTTKKCLKIEFALSFALWIWPLNFMNTLFMHFIFHLQKTIWWNNQFNNNYFHITIKLNKHALYLLTVSMILIYLFSSCIYPWEAIHPI